MFFFVFFIFYVSHKWLLRRELANPTSQSFHCVEKLIRKLIPPLENYLCFLCPHCRVKRHNNELLIERAQPKQWEKSLAASEKIDLPLNPEPAIAINKHYTFYKPPTTQSMAVNISGRNRDDVLH